MIPGLCCAACLQPFGGRVAKVTDEGYVHSAKCVSPAELTDGYWAPTGRGTMVWVDRSSAA